MNQIYTDETFIQFYYHECDLFETLEIEHALENDAATFEAYHGIKEVLDSLSSITYSPSQQTIRQIMKYSKILAVEC